MNISGAWASAAVRGVRFWMTSRRLGLFLCLVGFVWGITLINMTLLGYHSGDKDSNQLKEEILSLSEKYVKELARETENTIDGPYAGRLTGYDLKKTLAVLLESMLERLNRLEKRVNEAIQNNTLNGGNNADSQVGKDQVPAHYNPNRVLDGILPPAFINHVPGNNQEQPPVHAVEGLGPKLQEVQPKENQLQEPIDARGLILGEQEQCDLDEAQNKAFPHCQGKITWMRAHWKSDQCYAATGVDGSDCSFRYYLSEVESWCPRLPGREEKVTNSTDATEYAAVNLDLESLLRKLQDPGQRQNYAWIRMRIRRLWPRWEAAARHLAANQDLTHRKKQRVLVHLGLLTKQSGFKIAESSFKGGPLGELVQWSDIISALYVLGHDVTVTSEVEQLQAFVMGHQRQRSYCPLPKHRKLDMIYSDIMGLRQFKRIVRASFIKYRIVSKLPSAESLCQIREKLPIDMIYTDIVGLSQFKRRVKNGYGKFSCLLRIIDSFGTEPAFNYEPYAKSHRLKTQWGMQNLNPQQFFTMFPHSPDNSFMGFVVENHINDSHSHQIVRQNQALVYGKAEYMWKGHEKYLDIIRQYVDVHGTVFVEKPGSLSIPRFVHNHGILSGPDLHSLLRESKLFIGMGFPYEGPAPLEAIAQGAVFINPRFNPPQNSANTKFFKGKPTLRQVTSQHPYAEEFIGEPHVFTVDINNEQELRNALQRALKAIDSSQVAPYLPYEYTEGGLLQRLNAYIQHQDFCRPHPNVYWPPESSVQAVLAAPGVSCKSACMKQKLICEPSHFPRMNNQDMLEKYIGSCTTVTSVNEIFFPAFQVSNGQCLLQAQPMLYSCVGAHPDYQRLCPCRNFQRGQVSLCDDCL